MTRPAVKVENLSKQYKIGLHAPFERNFREAVADAITAPIRRLRALREGPSEGTDRFWALRDVNFTVAPGEVVGIIGRNGAGKSTLLKILSRITRPTEGRAVTVGRVGSLLEVGTGFHPDLTGWENIYLNGAILGMTKAEITRNFDQIVAFSGVEKFLDTPVKRYSSGMRVRLGFAVAAHLAPDILIVDEVLAVGDAEFQRRCLGKMGEVASSGRTVLFVSHNMQAVTALCSRAVQLEGGRIAAEGTAAEVVERYLLNTAGPLDAANAVRTFDDDPAKAAQINKVTLLNAGGTPSLTHQLVDPVTIEVEFTCRKAFGNLMVSVQMAKPDGTDLMGVNEVDWHNHTADAMVDQAPKAVGRYVGRVTLPAPLLNVGRYELRVLLAEPMVAEHDKVAGIAYDIVDSGSFSSYIFKRARRALLSMPVPWEVARAN